MSQLTVAASEKVFRELFAVLRDNFTFSDSDSASFGPFSAGYSFTFHLENGTVDLRDDNTVEISELDIKWDFFQLGIGFDIPEICVGGWCIIPNPLPFGDDCLLSVPKVCVFSENPDIDITLDLSNILTTEISLITSLLTRYWVDPARLPGMSDLDAEDANIPNKWQIFLDPKSIDVDLFDISDIVGDLLEQAVRNAINGLIPGPDWFKDIIFAILGPIIDLIRATLDIPDDIREWLLDLLSVRFDILNITLSALANYFATREPIFRFEDPYPILPASGGLIPVKIPIRDLAVQVNTNEMIIEGNVGV